MDELRTALQTILADSPARLVLSAPRAGSGLRKATARAVGGGWQIERLTADKAFHQNLPAEELPAALEALLREDFTQLASSGGARQHSLRITKKGRVLTQGRATEEKIPSATHDRVKATLLPPGVAIPPLVDMGVLTRDGAVVAAMRDKYRQIDRFLQLVEDALKTRSPQSLTVVDFGCGKSYLTFVLYHYLAEVRGIPTRMTGLDLKADVVAHCNQTAQKYGYGGLSFRVGDVAGYTPDGPVDMVVSLHACDTATDHALATAVGWGAQMVFSVPCCQHELNAQMRSEDFALLTRYGIVKERFAALVTDAVRANLMAACGYKTQLVEFVGFEHTPKNIMIRAVKAAVPAAKRAAALAEVDRVLAEFALEPTLYRLLKERGLLPRKQAEKTKNTAEVRREN